MKELAAGTLAAEVALLCKLAGFEPEEQHRAFLDGVFEVTPEGKVAHPRFEVCADRDARHGVFQRCVIGWLFLSEQSLVLWAADTWTEARVAFDGLAEVIHGSDLLCSRLTRMRRTNGDQELRLSNGSRLLMRAGGGVRGISASRLIIDRADKLTHRDAANLLPVLSARPDAQALYGYPKGNTGSSAEEEA